MNKRENTSIDIVWFIRFAIELPTSNFLANVELAKHRTIGEMCKYYISKVHRIGTVRSRYYINKQ